jgi:hypothetical protein
MFATQGGQYGLSEIDHDGRDQIWTQMWLDSALRLFHSIDERVLQSHPISVRSHIPTYGHITLDMRWSTWQIPEP